MRVAIPSEFHTSNGWVVDALPAAVATITTAGADGSDLDCSHLAEALKLAARSGGDTDTLAAIAGSLLGARWGASAVPLAWRRRLHGRRLYGEPPLRCGDLEQLARLGVNGGHPDPQGWPGIEEMIPHYVERFRLSPLVVEIDGVLFGNAAGIHPAIERGATAVVSLCRMGTSDIPDGVEHLTVPLIDTTLADNPNLAFVLADTARMVAELANSGERMFVHCVASENRTPTIAAAYLMARGSDRSAALARMEAEFGRRPVRFLLDGLADAEPLLTANRIPRPRRHASRRIDERRPPIDEVRGVSRARGLPPRGTAHAGIRAPVRCSSRRSPPASAPATSSAITAPRCSGATPTVRRTANRR